MADSTHYVTVVEKITSVPNCSQLLRVFSNVSVVAERGYTVTGLLNNIAFIEASSIRKEKKTNEVDAKHSTQPHQETLNLI